MKKKIQNGFIKGKNNEILTESKEIILIQQQSIKKRTKKTKIRTVILLIYSTSLSPKYKTAVF